MTAGSTAPTGPVRVQGRVLAVKRAGVHHVVTMGAPGVAERFRPGTFVALALGGLGSDDVLARTYPIHRACAAGAHGGTVDMVTSAIDPATERLVATPGVARVPIMGPLGRPFALPKQPVSCLLVGTDEQAATLFPLAAKLRERGCSVHMLLGARTEAALFGVLEARRSTNSLTVTTADGSVGVAGRPADVVTDLVARVGADVVYAAGPVDLLLAVAEAAEKHGAWSQARVAVPMPCGIGLCRGCLVPVVAEAGASGVARACTEGPVFRGDRVRWHDWIPDGVPDLPGHTTWI